MFKSAAIQEDVHEEGLDALRSSLSAVCRKLDIFSNDNDALRLFKTGVSRVIEHSIASVPGYSNQTHKADIALINQGLASFCDPQTAQQDLQLFLDAVRAFIVRVCAKERAPIPNILTAPVSSAGATTQTGPMPTHTFQGPSVQVPATLPPALSGPTLTQFSPVDPRLQPRSFNRGIVHEVPFTSRCLGLPWSHDCVVSMYEKTRPLGGTLLEEQELYELAHFLDGRILESIYKNAMDNFPRPSREQVQQAYQTRVEMEHAKCGEQVYFHTVVDDF